MPNINDKNVKPEVETEKVTKKANEKVKTPRKPREKVRPTEEIINLPETKLTDKEKVKLIKALKENNMLLANQVEAFKQNSETAFAQARNKEEAYEAMERFYRGRLQYINTQLAAFGAAVNEAIKGGIE